jgi:hypothetical protein
MEDDRDRCNFVVVGSISDADCGRNRVGDGSPHFTSALVHHSQVLGETKIDLGKYPWCMSHIQIRLYDVDNI